MCKFLQERRRKQKPKPISKILKVDFVESEVYAFPALNIDRSTGRFSASSAGHQQMVVSKISRWYLLENDIRKSCTKIGSVAMLGGPHIVLVDYFRHFSPKLRCRSQKWIIFTIVIGTLYPKLCTMWCPRRYKLISKLHYISLIIP